MPEQAKKGKKIKVFTKKKKHEKPENEFIQQLQAKYDEKVDLDTIKSFSDFPLSPKTIKGLKASGYNKPTEIQKESLMLALCGKDILGAAQTGSGKTLAFIIPILEKLFCKQWTHLDGLGALVITPTRELAYQIFETLRRVGVNHDFSAGLIIGGKDLKFERRRMDQCNIIICTPGRLLHHMDENPLFDAVNLQILILDEADRCLDMGFEKTMNAIIANLPPKRQTLLFSATQTKSVRDLARLSLKDPCYISVHENAKHSTPPGLQQTYVVCELKDKLPTLWSFIKNHLKQKCIVFMSTCKQVKYVFEIFSKLRPGTSLMALYGTMHQLRRMKIYESFMQKSSAVLFATDLASRGLDFPEVHWVIQVDCPEDSDTYIHRVGRTARYHKGGESLLLLLPSELHMLEELEAKKIPISKIDINPLKLTYPIRKIEAYVTNSELQESAKRAFVAYIKAVFLMKNKKIFNVEALDINSFALSLGLAAAPRVRFMQRMNAKKNNNQMNINQIDNINSNKKYFDDNEDDDETLGNQDELPPKTVSENLEKINDSDLELSDEDNMYSTETKLNGGFGIDTGFGINTDNNDDVLDSENVCHVNIENPNDLEEAHASSSTKKKPTTKVALVKKMLKQKTVTNKKIIFNEAGEAVDLATGNILQTSQGHDNEESGKIDKENLKLVVREEDKSDYQMFKERVKAKHKEQKKKLKEKKAKEKEEIEDFGEDDSDEGPDLAWVPDPDKVYGNQTGEESSTKEFSDDESVHEEIEVNLRPESTKSKKKKRKQDSGTNDSLQTKEPPSKKHKNLEKMRELNSSLSVNEAEELALMLLKK